MWWGLSEAITFDPPPSEICRRGREWLTPSDKHDRAGGCAEDVQLLVVAGSWCAVTGAMFFDEVHANPMPRIAPSLFDVGQRAPRWCLPPASAYTRLRRGVPERRGSPADDRRAFSRARSLNLAKYSASVSGRMPGLVGTHSRGVVGIRRLSRRSAQASRRLRRGQRTPINRHVPSSSWAEVLQLGREP